MTDLPFTPALDHEEPQSVGIVVCRGCGSDAWYILEGGEMACHKCRYVLDGFKWYSEDQVQ